MSESLVLFPYQAEGVARIVRQRGKALVFDEPGLGKTAQTLTAAKELNVSSLLVICPASLQLNWRQELELWWGEVAAEANVVLSSKKKHFDGRIVIVSYGMAMRHHEELKARRFAMVVADEAHALKDPRSQQTQQLIPLLQRAPRKLLLTGTPIINEVVELFPLLRAVGLARMKYVEFGIRYAAGKKDVIWTTSRNGREQRTIWDFSGRSNEAELQVMMAPLTIRRLRSEVLPQLPEMIRTTLPVEPHVPIKGETEVSRVIRECLEESGRDVDCALADFQLRFRDDKEQQPVFGLYRETGEAKAPNVSRYLVDTVSQAYPVLVFAHHLKVLAGLEADLKAAGVLVASITGATPPVERQRLVDQFQAGYLDCLVLSLTAASTGLTLTRAKEIVVAELPWNPQTALQVEGRVYRIGLGHKLVVRYCVAPGSFDETLWGMLDRKALTAGAVLDGDAERHRLHLTERPAEGPVTSVLRLLFEDELRAMIAEAEVTPAGRWKPRVDAGRTKVLAS